MSELEKKLVEYMDKTAGAVEQVLEFSMEQAPMVAQEIVKYGFWSSIVATALLLVLVLIATRAAHHFYKLGLKDLHDPKCYSDGFGYFMASAILSIAILLATPTIFIDIEKVIKTTIAPRLYIIETLR